MAESRPEPLTSDEQPRADDELLVDSLIEEISIDGMCGVY
jgi:mycofactocin precursor